MGVSTANGHVGRFVAGMLGGKRVLVMQGRLHGYEGYTAQEVAFPVWLMAGSGLVRSSPPTLPVPSTRATASATSAS